MLDEAIIEARRLAANLHGIAPGIAHSAYLVWIALGSDHDHETLMAARPRWKPSSSNYQPAHWPLWCVYGFRASKSW